MRKGINIPLHIAIIPDGNRRWAKSQGLASLLGHRKGVENVELLIDRAKKLGIKYVTGWALSTENWLKRSPDENKYLFELLREFMNKFKNKIHRDKIRFIHLGRKDRLPKDILNSIADLELESSNYFDFTTAIGLDYGGNDELIRTFKKIQEKGLEITADNIEKNLDTHLMPAPDLIIRTGGEQRLSGFMSWQSAYSEYFFTQKYFPAFTPEDLEEAVIDFCERDRRYGGDSKNN